MNFSSLESASYRVRRHSSQMGEGKRTAHAIKAALESSPEIRLVECRAKKALPEFRGHHAPEHWEVIARFHSFADRIKGDKLAATFNLDKVEVVA